jgi:hypothetical protein
VTSEGIEASGAARRERVADWIDRMAAPAAILEPDPSLAPSAEDPLGRLVI